MQVRVNLVGLFTVLLTVGAIAQQAVTTAGGSTNVVPKFSGSATLANSAITESGGNVGIGTASPLQMLHVTGNILAGGDAIGAYLFGDYGAANGYVQGLGFNAYFDGKNWILPNDGANSGGALIMGSHGPGNIMFFTFSSAGGSTQTISNSNIGNYQRMVITNNGNLGVGTTTPGARLEVNGNIKLTSGSGASIAFADGTVQSTAWTGSLCGGDYAESVDVSGERKQYEPGDVLVIDPSHPGNFLKSTKPYSRLVAGIYSTKPGLIGRQQTTTDPTLRAEEVPMAMVGIVPTKVTAENGPIEVGDLMVTSSQPGYAMKGTDGLMKTGTVIGKALGSLPSGTGVIEVLVSLQ